MSRKAKKTSVLRERYDSRFNSVNVLKFANKIMLKGKKNLSLSIVYKVLDNLGEKTQLPQLEAFEKALANIRPAVEVRSRRVGGSVYQVPVEVSLHRGDILAMRWLITSARKRPGHSIVDRFTAELMDAVNGSGNAVKRREEMYRMAEANRAFAHYRW